MAHNLKQLKGVSVKTNGFRCNQPAKRTSSKPDGTITNERKKDELFKINLIINNATSAETQMSTKKEKDVYKA